MGKSFLKVFLFEGNLNLLNFLKKHADFFSVFPKAGKSERNTIRIL